MSAWKCKQCGHEYDGPQRPCPECSKREHSFAAPPCSPKNTAKTTDPIWDSRNSDEPAIPKLKTIDGIPRRIRIDLHTYAERAISKAVDAVELAGADPLLTDAVMLLTAAKAKVADYVERQELWQCPICGNVMTEEQSKEYRACPTGIHATAHVRIICDSENEKALPRRTKNL